MTRNVDTRAVRLWPWIAQCSELTGRDRAAQTEASQAILAASDSGEYHFTNELLRRFGIDRLCPSCFHRFAERNGRVATVAGDVCGVCALIKKLEKRRR